MSNAIRLDARGLRDLQRTMRDLPDALKRSAETAVLRSGATPIRDAAKGFAAQSKDSGLLLKSMGLTVEGKRGNKVAKIGPRKGFAREVTRTDKRTGRKIKVMADPNKYSHLVEYGTSHSPAQPFIRPAVDASEGQTVDAMAAGLDKHLTKVTARVAKK